jgi:ankyrin repeat protein
MYNMRLTRNLDNRTPLSIIRSYSQKGGPIRGQPNFKRKLLEFLESIIAQDPSFQDTDQDQDIHEAVIKGNSETVRRMLSSFGDNKKGQVALLEWRNHQGKTSLHLAIEHK